jgi:hypothetical protein
MSERTTKDVSRSDRDALIQLVHRYLSEEITAFEFDELLFMIGSRTSDATVKWGVDWLWGFYDDCKDHKVVSTKQEWDAVQRLLLVLSSDGTVKVRTRREWTLRQFVAGFGLISFLFAIWQTGFGDHLFLAALPLGIVSMLLHQWQERCEASVPAQKQERLVPFGSVSELLRFRRLARGFLKTKYPTRLAGRRIRSRTTERLLQAQEHLLWLAFSPIVLLVQALPECHSEWSVTTA